MKKIILIALIAFIFSSCTLIPSKKSAIDTDIRTGTDGLVMNFVQGTPPTSVYESGQGGYEGIFEFSATLANKGASDIKQGYLMLAYEEDYVELAPNGGWTVDDLFSTQEKTTSFVLNGKSIQNPAGEQKMFTNKLKTKMLDELSEKHDSLLQIISCYDYSTVQSAAVCIDTNPYETGGVKPCTVKDLTFTSQGAPVAITKIESAMLPSGGNTVKPEFKIYIKNKGSGEVINKEKIGLACSPKITPEDKKDLWNIVDITLSLGGEENGQFECTPIPMKLKSDEDYVRCVYTSSIMSAVAYQTTLVINLTYGYTQTISKSISIIKNPSLHTPVD